ncbi:MAG TPA: sulfatase-like hydrolase/transferase [Bryobacteraceae bacterium]|jgi:choline-sulfatase
MHNLSRRNFLGTAAASAALPRQSAARKRPNFVFFMPDELRAESLACYGHPVVKTPNFDRLAAEGVRFDQCHVQNTVCGPSRCSLMTGWPVHVRGHRSLYYGLHPDEPNLLRYLKEDGYDVYFFGKNDLLSPDSFPLSVTEWDSKTGDRQGNQNPWKPDDPHYYSFLFNKLPDRRKTSDYENLQRAIDILKRPSDKPFCIYLPLLWPHPPFTAPEDFYSMYQTADLPPLRPPGLPRKPNFHAAIRHALRLDQLSGKDFRTIQAVYLGMVSYSDWLLGELMQALEQSGHVDDTALFTFADHGEWAGDFGLVEKWPSAMEDPLTRVPLIARVPGAKQGHVSQEIVELFDVMATCLDLAGIEARHTHFARTLSPQLHGASGDTRRAAFCEGGYNVYEPQCFEPLQGFSNPLNIYYPKVKLQNEHPETVTRSTMIRTLESKLILRPDGQSELYDLKKDPRELHNFYGDRSYASSQSELEGRVLNWYIRTSDVAPMQLDPRGFPARHTF